MCQSSENVFVAELEPAPVPLNIPSSYPHCLFILPCIITPISKPVPIFGHTAFKEYGIIVVAVRDVGTHGIRVSPRVVRYALEKGVLNLPTLTAKPSLTLTSNQAC